MSSQGNKSVEIVEHEAEKKAPYLGDLTAVDFQIDGSLYDISCCEVIGIFWGEISQFWIVFFRLGAVILSIFGLSLSAIDFTVRGVYLWTNTDEFFGERTATADFGNSAGAIVGCIGLLLADSVDIFAAIDPTDDLYKALSCCFSCSGGTICGTRWTWAFVILWIILYGTITIGMIFVTLCLNQNYFGLIVPLLVILGVALPVFGNKIAKRKRARQALVRNAIEQHEQSSEKLDVVTRGCYMVTFILCMVGVPSGLYEMGRGFNQMRTTCFDEGVEETDILDILAICVGGILLWAASLDVIAVIRYQNENEHLLFAVGWSVGWIFIVFYVSNLIVSQQDSNNGYGFIAACAFAIFPWIWYFKHKSKKLCSCCC